jgi:hypothetical protein
MRTTSEVSAEFQNNTPPDSFRVHNANKNKNSVTSETLITSSFNGSGGVYPFKSTIAHTTDMDESKL